MIVVFFVVVFGFGPFFRYVAPTVLRVSITFPARIAISRYMFKSLLGLEQLYLSQLLQDMSVQA